MSDKYNRKDHYYLEAKSQGYRSRAAFKLIEINNKYGLLKPGIKVLDLGAWPGGWLQVASKLIKSGVAVGIDLQAIDPIADNVHLIHGDAREEQVIEQALSLAGGQFNVLLSDMSAKLTGIKEADQAASSHLAELSLYVAEQVLAEGGTFLIKVFKGNDIELFIKAARTRFDKFIRAELKASRKTSNEFYCLGFGFKK